MKEKTDSIRIFISHAASDRDLAIFVKETLEKSLRGIEVFCSSDPTDLPPGAKWSKEIQDQLESSAILLLIATSRGLKRPWVWFECGTFWFVKRKIIPLCIGTVRKNELPSPFSERMALNMDDSTDVNGLFRVFDAFPSVERVFFDISEMIISIKKIEEEIRERALKEDEGWVGACWGNYFLSIAGPFQTLQFIEDRAPEQGMREALKKNGFKHRFSSEDKIPHYTEMGYHIVFLTDRKKWSQRIISGRQVLMAKSKNENKEGEDNDN